MALQCNVTTVEGLVATGAYIRPQFEVRKKVNEGDVKTAFLFVECEVYVNATAANAYGSKRLSIPSVDRFKGAWDTDGASLEAQGYALIKAQPALAGAVDV